MKIGILALQGDFEAHGKMVASCGGEPVFVKKREVLTSLDGLILPGGESTTQAKLIEKYHFMPTIEEFHRQGKAIFGTCAGAILLSAKSNSPQIKSQPTLAFLQIEILRNAYGSQRDSFEASLTLSPSSPFTSPLAGFFIRAPKIEKVHDSVEILATYNESPVLVQQGSVLAATFHPELTEDRQIHQYFLSLCRPCLQYK